MSTASRRSSWTRWRTGRSPSRKLIALTLPEVPRRLHPWLEQSWSAFRSAIVEGLICYGPPEGSAVTFVRTDQWLPGRRRPDASEAARELLRRFLGSYGPATVRDFSKWSGLTLGEARPVWQTLADELQAVTVDGEPMWILKRDLAALEAVRTDPGTVRLLPSFDTFLLAHATKDHLVERRHYKKVYRNQGWLSPVVLQGGRIVGVWKLSSAGGDASVDVEPFGTLGRPARLALEREAGELGAFLGRPCRVRVAR